MTTVGGILGGGAVGTGVTTLFAGMFFNAPGNSSALGIIGTAAVFAIGCTATVAAANIAAKSGIPW